MPLIVQCGLGKLKANTEKDNTQQLDLDGVVVILSNFLILFRYFLHVLIPQIPIEQSRYLVYMQESEPRRECR